MTQRRNCMEVGIEIKSSGWQPQRQTVKDELTSVHAGRRGVFIAVRCFCWFLFTVNWTLKKDQTKVNKAFFLSLLSGGNYACMTCKGGFFLRISSMSFGLPVLANGEMRGQGSQQETKPRAEAAVLGPVQAMCVMHSLTNVHIGRRRGIGLIAETWQSWICLKMGICSAEFSSMPTTNNMGTLELEGSGRYRACLLENDRRGSERQISQMRQSVECVVR